MKKLLIVNTLPEDDPAVFPALEVLGRGAEKVRVIHAYEKNFRPCIGCNACWLVTPGICYKEQRIGNRNKRRKNRCDCAAACYGSFRNI